MTGMTLVHHEWHPKLGAEMCSDMWGARYWQRSDLDHIETTHIVPDGTWIMERPTFGWSWLIGVEFAELTALHVTTEAGVSHIYYRCDRPFGYVVVDEDDIDLSTRMPRSNARKTFFGARQVHKGELSHGVPLLRETGYVRAHDKKRGNGWVRLDKLSAAAGIVAEDLLFGYWQFSQHVNYAWYYNTQDGGQLVDVVVAWTADDIEHKDPDVQSFTLEQMRKHLSQSTDQNLWVRHGFAYTILRLLKLGYAPALQPA